VELLFRPPEYVPASRELSKAGRADIRLSISHTFFPREHECPREAFDRKLDGTLKIALTPDK